MEIIALATHLSFLQIIVVILPITLAAVIILTPTQTKKERTAQRSLRKTNQIKNKLRRINSQLPSPQPQVPLQTAQQALFLLKHHQQLLRLPLNLQQQQQQQLQPQLQPQQLLREQKLI